MIIAVGAVVVGAIAQRVAGLGFAMMVAPFLILVFGPAQGVVLVLLCGIAASLVNLWGVRHHIDWGVFARMLLPSLLGVALGSMIVASTDVHLFQVVVGAALVVAIVGSVAITHTSVKVRGVSWELGASLVTGALLSSAGVGGPTMTIYATISRWDPRRFGATMQPYFAVLSAASIISALALNPHAWPRLGGPSWTALAVALVGGSVAGHFLARVLSPRLTKAIVIALALLGSVVTVANGISGLN